MTLPQRNCDLNTQNSLNGELTLRSHFHSQKALQSSSLITMIFVSRIYGFYPVHFVQGNELIEGARF